MGWTKSTPFLFTIMVASHNRATKLYYLLFLPLCLSLIVSCASEQGNRNSSSLYPLYKEGELLVKFKSDVSMSKAQSIHKAIGSDSKKRFKSSGVEHIILPPGLTVKQGIELYKTQPDVEYAEPNYIVRRAEIAPSPYPSPAGGEGSVWVRNAAVSNDTYFNLQWGLNNTGQEINGVVGTPDADIDAPEAWDLHTGDGSIIVAVLDTGVDYNHKDITDNIWINTGEIPDNGFDDDGNGYKDDVRGWNFAYPYQNSPSENNPMDDDVDSHGTHVAGIIGAVGNNNTGVSGVNGRVKIMPVKVLDSSGSGNMADVLEGIDYAITMGAKVINASYTYPQSCTKISPSLIEKDAIKSAGDAGVLFIAAAGNYSCDNDVYPFYPASHALNNIISVAASDSNDNFASSNYGPNSVHVTAPGDEVYSTLHRLYDKENDIWIDRYGYLSGTSMAAPFVTGLASLIASYHFNYTYIAIREAILSSVEQKPSFTNKLISKGRINAYNALTVEINTIPPFKPTHLRATTISNISNTQVDLTWVDNSFVESGYIIERKTGIDGIYTEIAILEQNATTYSDTTVSDTTVNGETTYYYRVRAYRTSSGNSNYSNYSNETFVVIQSSSSTSSPNPSPNISSDERCFLATAVYGSPAHPYVEALREFRDKHLLNNHLGRKFVYFYYKYSPAVSDVIRGSAFLKTSIRVLVMPVVMFIVYPYVSLLVFSALLILSTLIACRVVSRTKKRVK